jgi:hypothetical protein
MEPTTTTEASAEPDQGGGRGGSRPLPQSLIAAVIALAVGLGAGFVIGWKVEQGRVKDDVKELKARLREATAPKEEPNEEPQNAPTASRPQGTVTAVSADSVTIDDAGTEKVIELSSSTQVETASAGTAADITQGATILLKSQRTTGPNFNALEIIVLPSVTEFSGHEVTSVAAGSITTSTSSGTANVALSDATVINKTAAGTLADITQGSIIVVRAEESTDGTLSALEVVVLPAGSTFIA